MAGRDVSPEEYFATQWPDLVPKLRAMLARAGAPVADRDDLVQETALRLYKMWPSIDQARGVDSLARRIATNAWRDQWRRRGEREVVGDLPETASESDTERVALARVEVLEVSRALRQLRPAVADVLRLAAHDAEGPEAAIATTAAVRMARTRARRALVACLEVASAAAGMLSAFGLRWLGRPARATTALGAVATVAFVVALAGPGAAPAPGPGLDVWPATSVSDTVRTHGLSPSAVSPARSARATAATGSRHLRKPAAAPTPFYVLDAGPAGSASLYVDVEVQGYGAQIRRPVSTTPQPVCGYGATPNTPVTPRCGS